MELRNPDWFRYLLEERGYSAATFALSIGVTPATIHRILAGTRNASPALAARISTALDQGMTILFRVAPATATAP